MDDYPVKVGSMLFTLVDPTPGNEVAYNRWYERDHFYGGCLTGPWLFAGSRWVSTRPLKDLRYSDGTGEVCDPVDKGSWVSIYWVESGHHDDHFGWARKQVYKLYGDGRGFNERVHAHTILADSPRAVYRDPDGVPLELALDHRYDGLISVALDRTQGTTEEELNEYLDTVALPALVADSPIAIASSWKPELREGEAPMDLGTLPGTEARQMQLMFVDEKPESAWADVQAYVAAVDASGKATVRWAGPFYPTVVGTDTYVDQIW